MFRSVRKKRNEISMEEVKDLLISERRGVLAMNGEDGYPYAIPLNFWYCEEENRIYFHGARAGYKVDLLRTNNKVCFTVYGKVSVTKEPWAPFVQSAVVFGTCHLVEDREQACTLVEQFARKYYPDAAMVKEEVAVSGKAVQMFAIDIEHMTGKEIQEK